MPDIAQWIQEVSYKAIPFMLAIICHEVAHGWVALKLGDPTAKQMGRLTLNPIKHLDLMGTLVFVMTQMIGWAKPVPVNPRYFKNPVRGMQLVAVAGPLTNFILAVVCAAALGQVAHMAAPEPGTIMAMIIEPLGKMLMYGVIINLVIGIFNLIPIPPMDGSNILAGFLPRTLAYKYMSLGRWGMVIVILLAVAGVIGKILSPLVDWGWGLLLHFFIQ